MAQEITINQLDPITFEYQTYSDKDNELIVQSELDTVFSPDTDYIEYYAYDQNLTLIYPGSTIPLLNYDIREGDVILNPEQDLIDSGYDLGTFNILYNFYRRRLSSDISQKYFISDISSDRTEIRLDSNIISNDLIISSSNSFIQYRENASYFVDFYLNFGLNQTVIANNIKLETDDGVDPTVLIKLYEPLPSNFNIKDELWVVEELSSPQAYELNFPFDPIVEDDFTYISGPNYNLNVTQQTSTGGKQFSFNTLLQSDVTSSINQIQNLLNQKEIDINVNYENYSNFIHFSSAKTRLENFVYKVGLIESASNQLSSVLGRISGGTTNTIAYSSSKAILTSQIDTIIKNFDGYESFLYFNSGSKYSYPKQNTTPPFQLYPTGSVEASTWVGSTDLGSPYYGGQAVSASNYDQNNNNWLYFSIPEYLRDDPANERYELFVDMVAQYYDNIWVYTKDISNKFDADNRLEYGIAKDLVADAIKDFGVKLYASNFNTDDLFTAFLGLTPSGSTFPFPNITGSVVDGSGNLSIPSGFEYIDTEISASNDIVPLNNVQKQLYKRIYHNIPYLLKTKGTIAGIRALITSYGIPDTILRISEFGGKDRNESQDYDLKQNVFNYAFDTDPSATTYLTSSFEPNAKFVPVNDYRKTIQFRFKPAPIPLPTNNIASSNIRYSQSLWSGKENGDILLEYTGSGFVSGSYSGSIASPYDNYGTLRWIPAESDDPTVSASIFLPFFNGDWWSVQATIFSEPAFDGSSSIFAANEINGKIGFSGSGEANGFDSDEWLNITEVYLNTGSNITVDSKTYQPFSGSYQELRYWDTRLSESKFFDYTVNPYSDEGNTVNSTPKELYFRTDLGTQLNTSSRTSIHPRITGSAVQITQSFSNDSSGFTFLSGSVPTEQPKFIINRGPIFQDQVPAGIKNRITNKIQAENLILAEAPYGFRTPTSSEATISSTTSDVISPMESIQQHSFVSQSYTPNVNYLEVAFSPSNQINDDINAQIGYFNLGDYIGDPRQNFSSSRSYPDLDVLRDAYFEKYIRGYDVADFIRLIKFFDNSLFKMIEDFTPARTSLASGVVVKQHLLERNRQRPALVTSSRHEYEGLVVNLPKDYSSGSSDFPQYSTEGSAIYKFTGGPGGSFNRFNGLQTYPSGTLGLGPGNIFFLTQSWTDSADFSVINSLNFNQSNSFYISASGGAGKFPGIGRWIKDNQSEFYDGIFSGSKVDVTDGDLNPGCEPYLNVSDSPIVYNPLFFSFNSSVQGTVSSNAFLDNRNNPVSGDAWIASDIVDGQARVQWVKLARFDVNNNEVGEYLVGAEKLTIIFQEGTKEYYIAGVTVGASSTLINISQTAGDYTFTWSEDGGSENFSLIATGSFTASYNGNDNNAQGNFVAVDQQNQNQRFWFWGDQDANTANYDTTNDTQGFFNPGADDVTYNDIVNIPGEYQSGAYSLGRTPNIPLYFSCSVAFSASDLGSTGEITTENVYHSASNNNPNVEDQTITLQTGSYQTETQVVSGVYRPSSGLTYSQLNMNSVFFRDFANTNIGSDIDDPRTTAGTGHSSMTNIMTSSFKWNIPTLECEIWSTMQGDANGEWFPISSSAYTTPTPSPTPTGTWNSLGVTAGLGTLFAAGVGCYQLNGDGFTTEISNANGTIGLNANNIDNVFTYVGFSVNCATGTNVTFSIAEGQGNVGNSYEYEPNTIQSNGPIGIILTSSGTSYDNYVYWPENLTGLDASIPDNGLWIEDPNDSGVWKLGGQDGSSGATAVTNALHLTGLYPYGGDGSGGMKGISSYFQIIAYSPTEQTNISNVTVNDLAVYAEIDASISFGGPTQYYSYYDYLVGGINTGRDSGNFLLDPQNDASFILRFPTFDLEAHLMVTGSGADSNPARRITSSGKFEVELSQSFGDGSQEPYVIRFPMGAPQTVPYGDGEMLGYFDIPVKNVEYDASDPATTSSTQTQTDDMFFIEYSMSNYFNPYALALIGGGKNRFGQTRLIFDASDQNVPSIPSMTSSFLQITSSVNQVVGGNTATGSIYIQSTNNDTNNVNFLIGPNGAADENRILISSSDQTGRVSFTGSTFGNFDYLSNLRMGIAVSKSFSVGFTVTEYSMSIFPSSSDFSPFDLDSRMSDGTKAPVAFGRFRTPDPTAELISTFFGNNIVPFNLATDCQPLLNNYITQRANPYIFDIDYNLQSANTASYFFFGDTYTASRGDSAAPVNLRQIISGSAVKAPIPESNYTILRSINPRYNGAKSTSQELNVWNIGDTGTYGKNPTIELRDAFFGYFNDLDDPYPNINGLTRINLNYLIDEQGNALPPSLDPLSIDTFQAVFPNTTLGSIAAKSGKGQYRTLGSPASIDRTMQYVTPIIYSQNSANNYAPMIPLSGSGYVSQYDNGDANDALFARFSAQGSASIDTSYPQQSVDYYLDPSEFVTGSAQNDYPEGDVAPLSGGPANPWDVAKRGNGTGANAEFGARFKAANYSNWISTTPAMVSGSDLPSSQIVTIQTSFVTSFVSETNRTRDELKFEVHMYSSGSGAAGVWTGAKERSFNLEDIECKVYTDDGRVTNIGSVLNYGWFEMTNIIGYYKVVRSKSLRQFLRRWRFKRWRYSRIPVPTGGIRCTADWEMYETLFDLGLMRERKSKGGAGVQALEWIITANSGKYTIQGGDAINWRINGEFKNARGGYRQGLFFPLDYTGAYTSVNIQGQGANDYLMGEANTAKAPYWVYTGSAGAGNTNILDQSILVMSSSNLNEAYGTTFRQGDLEYFPGQSDYFPSGVEPATTAFDRIENTIQLFEGDEIRFSNNENYTYTIEEVFAPAENVEQDSGQVKRPRLKIKLSGPVPKSINKNFFLVRRPVVNPNSLYLDTPFPYENLASASISTVIKSTGSFINAGPDGAFAISSSAFLNGVDADGNYTASLSSLELQETPGILYPDFPTEYLVQSASVIVNDLISKGIIES